MYGITKCVNFLAQRDKEIIHSHLCNVCDVLATNYGNSSRIYNNYDSAFISLLTCAQKGNTLKSRKHRCLNFVSCPSEFCDGDRYAAAITICAAYLKAKDDMFDEKSLVNRIRVNLMQKRVDLALRELRNFDFPYRILDELLNKQISLEQNQQISLLECMEPSEVAASKVFAHTAEISDVISNRDPLEKIGKYIGRIMYIIDNYIDLESDISHGRFNPLAVEFNLREKTYKYTRSKINKLCHRLVYESLTEIKLNIKNVKFKTHRELIHKILVKGLNDKVSAIFNGTLRKTVGKMSYVLPYFLFLQQSNDCCGQVEESIETHPCGPCGGIIGLCGLGLVCLFAILFVWKTCESASETVSRW